LSLAKFERGAMKGFSDSVLDRQVGSLPTLAVQQSDRGSNR
jgi:hypothetical protein